MVIWAATVCRGQPASRARKARTAGQGIGEFQATYFHIPPAQQEPEVETAEDAEDEVLKLLSQDIFSLLMMELCFSLWLVQETRKRRRKEAKAWHLQLQQHVKQAPPDAGVQRAQGEEKKKRMR